MSLYRSKALELYRLMLRGANHIMPTRAGRDFMLTRVRAEFRLHKEETDPKRIEELLYRAHGVLMTAAENATADYEEVNKKRDLAEKLKKTAEAKRSKAKADE